MEKFPRYWPFVREIHRSPVNFPYKGQWRGALMFSLIRTRMNGWVNNREAGDLRRYRVHYDVIVMFIWNRSLTDYRLTLAVYFYYQIGPNHSCQKGRKRFAYDVIKWKHFPRNWHFGRGIHRSPVNSLHKGQWRGALMFSLICAWINSWVSNR